MTMGENSYLACSVGEFGGRDRTRKRIRLGGRDIFIVKANNTFYALDSFCYHVGGPLHQGDIEDLGDRTCMICPWHKYKVCLDTGQNYYQQADPFNKVNHGKWVAGKVLQRTHPVEVRDGQIYVTVSPADGTLASDQYNNRDKDKNSSEPKV